MKESKILIKSALLLCAAVVLPLISMAGMPEALSSYKMDPTTLGHLDAMLTLCARADAAHRATFERYRTELVVFGEGTAYEMRAEGSDTPQYKQAYQVLTTEMSQRPEEDIAAQCAKFIDAKS